MRVVWCFPAEVRGGMGPACLPSGCSCCPRRPVRDSQAQCRGCWTEQRQGGGPWGTPSAPQTLCKRREGAAPDQRAQQACLDPVPLRGPLPLPCSGPGSYRCGGGVCCVSIARVPKSEGPGPPACRPACWGPACAPLAGSYPSGLQGGSPKTGFSGTPDLTRCLYSPEKLVGDQVRASEPRGVLLKGPAPVCCLSSLLLVLSRMTSPSSD